MARILFATQTFFASLVCLLVSMVGGVLLVFLKVFVLHSLGFILSGSSSFQGRFPFPFEGFFFLSSPIFFYFFFTGLKLTPSSTFYFYFSLPIEWQEVTKCF